MFRPILIALFSAAMLGGYPTSACSAFQDPLDVPAIPSQQISHSMLFAIANAGHQRVVAVGARGDILFSDDNAQSWQQSVVPVSIDLLAVSFPNAQDGWAVGHGGVVLHTVDGGRSWLKQLDGKQVAALSVAYYEKFLPSTDAVLLRALDEAKRYAAEGAVRPFLDVLFENAKVGYVIGSFNMMLKTVDGGKTWTPWSERIGNENVLHLHAIRAFANDLYVVGEQGLMLKLDRDKQRFVNLPKPYDGTFFGLIGTDKYVITYGMRGNAFRSQDHGQTWEKLPTNINASITSGAVLADGKLVLGTGAGNLLISSNGGDSFSTIRNASSFPFFGMVPAGSGVLVVGPAGVRTEPLK